MNDLNAFTGLVRRCVEDYDMIAPGDTVAVGVSGGKDSLVLLMALNELRRYYPKPFALEAITVELGFDGMDFTPVAELCETLGVPYTRLKTDIKEVVFDVRKEDNPCSLCAKMRRGALCTALSERGMEQLAVQAEEAGFDYLLIDGPAGLPAELSFLAHIATQAIIVTQDFHEPRAVSVCRAAGVEVRGVADTLARNNRGTWVRSWLRERAAAVKAAWDVLSGREPILGRRETSVEEAIAWTRAHRAP